MKEKGERTVHSALLPFLVQEGEVRMKCEEVSGTAFVGFVLGR